MSSFPSPHHQAPSTILSGVPSGAEALVLAEILAGRHLEKTPGAILYVAMNDRQLDMTAQALEFFAPDAEVLRFPAWDAMPYDRASPLASLMAERMRVLAMLAAGQSAKTRLVLTTASAIVQKLPPRDAMRQIAFSLRKGERLGRDALLHYLAAQGYRRAGRAMEPGEFALRGSIIDIMPPGHSEGIRIDLFGEDIESLRRYDPLSQVSQGNLESIVLYPVSEILLSEEHIARFREAYRELFGAVHKDDPLYEAISQGQGYPGMEHWLPLFYGHADTLFDYCPQALVALGNDAQTAIAERQESIHEYYEARLNALGHASAKNSFAAGSIYNPVPPERGFLMEAAWEACLAERECVVFSPFAEEPGAVTLHYHPVLRFAQGQADRTPFDQLRERMESAAGKPALLACFSEGSRDRLQTLLMERGFHGVTVGHWLEIGHVRGKAIGLAVLPLENGFETDEALILSEQDVLGERIVRARAKKKKSEVFLAESANFTEGELVVHKEHGIGRFEGLVTLTVSGAAHDCLKIIYDGDDKLFLPVENIDMVSRFGLEEEGAKLDKLGGVSWQARKAKLKERIKIAAEALLKTAAERQLHQGAMVDVPTGAFEDFCARFPYVETEDQARAIADVLEDLHSGKPMDRLICGDVGFGKTEVALRAAFVCAIPRQAEGVSGDLRYQVAVITPTTLLARQHYRNFRQRFEGFPVKIRQLSRMVPTREQKETRAKLASGEVDIVIGTHALLSKQVQFKNLGLMIVDEEQHFGVVQKEKLKGLKSDVHVLTLSATPIPRTLQMALTGVRDLSLITTPPIDRLAVRSFVMPFDPVVVREAILREMHRGGKTFVVTPRIKDIAELKKHLGELLPEARLAVAHGQMAAAELDSIMNDFYDGKYDLLLSTAIIESGLDIPTANTMIIHNAHLLGLSQLYQLRGRVGRGKTRAYAYFLLPHRRQLTKNATRRLEVMQTLDTLGAGFTLASHDMDIRGFGNLVGEEQSGHIREVGIELYQQMLEEAVTALRQESGIRNRESVTSDTRSLIPDASDFSPQINLGLSVLIPETYVSDLQLRLGLYRRMAGLQADADIDSFSVELIDRFGPMPEETRHLIAVLSIKLLCRRAGIERMDIGPKGAVISFHNNVFAKPEALLTYVSRHARTLKARPDQKLVFTHEWKDAEDKVAVIKKLAGEIAELAV
ncbi:MAG: transcription-repair coupling factor [Pseudomonadota bacterium]|nr:transcription-repair coupling factor [Pseudomonadota bacterium]